MIGTQIASVKIFQQGDVVDPNTFTNGFAGFNFFFSYGPVGADLFVGFKTNAGNVGWFKVEGDSIQEPVTFSDGEFGSAGE